MGRAVVEELLDDVVTVLTDFTDEAALDGVAFLRNNDTG